LLLKNKRNLLKIKSNYRNFNMGDKDNNIETIIIGCLGDSNVGKTYLTRKYVKDKNVDFNIPTVGIEFFMTKRILSNGKKY
jgi:GTPase SAR1 family protein